MQFRKAKQRAAATMRFNQHRSVSGDTELFEKVSKINGLRAVDMLNMHQNFITVVRVSYLDRCFLSVDWC